MAYFSTKSLLFNAASSQYASGGDVLAFDRLDPCSFSFWFKAPDSVGSHSIISKKGDGLEYVGWSILCGNKVAFHWARSSGGVCFGETVSTGWGDGEWHHGLVAKGAGSDITDFDIYVDGSLQTVSVVYNALNTGSILTTNHMWVGAEAKDGGSKFFDGNLDEIGVYNVKLDAAAATWLYGAGMARGLKDAGAPLGLVSWWNMGENVSINTVPDQQGSNNLTMFNSPSIELDAPGVTQYQSTYLKMKDQAAYNLYTSPPFDPDVDTWKYDSTYLKMSEQAAHHDEWWYKEWYLSDVEAGPTKKYKMRAKDLSEVPGGYRYVTWVSDYPDFGGDGFSGATPSPLGFMEPGSATVVAEWEE